MCNTQQRSIIRRKYHDGSIKAVYVHLTYQGFNAPLFEELVFLKAYHERRDDESAGGGNKRKIADAELGGKPKKSKKSKKSKRSSDK